MSATITLTATVAGPFTEVLEKTRSALTANGFGIITEIDLAQTLRDKVGAELAPQVILGACRPQLAHQAIIADPAIAAMLPCNVVVRASTANTTVVEAFDPELMTNLLANPVLAEVAADARERLLGTLAQLAGND